MTFAFNTKSEEGGHLVAASHPRDQTVRPNVVTQAANPGYHKLIKHFEKLTGRGVVLNTSFNLHGSPVVNSPEDAINVLMSSGLEYLALNNFLIHKPMD